MKQAFLEVGRILTTHGLDGEVKFEHWGDSPETAEGLSTFYLSDDMSQPLKRRSCRRHGRFLLLRFEGVTDIDSAALLRSKILYARREDLHLPDGAILRADLIGLPVRDAKSGRLYGTICDIKNLGASDIWEIETEGGVVLFPAAPVFVSRIDTEDCAEILPPDGIFT